MSDYLKECAVCGLKAPVKPTRRYTVDVSFQEPDITGWMVVITQFDDFRHQNSETATNIKEWMAICPKCARHIVGTINHHKKPMLSEDDL